MKTQRKSWLILLSAVLVPLHPHATGQQLRLTAQADSTHYRIGDWIHLILTADAAPAVQSLQPMLTDSLGQFEVLHTEQKDPHTWHLRLTTFDTGRVVLPPIPFTFRMQGDTALRTAFSNALTFTVAAPPVNPQEDIRDIKPPLDAPWLWEDVRPYVIALVVLAAASAGYYYWRARRKQREELFVPPKPAIAPHTLALMQLRELEEKRLWQQGCVKEYHSEVTEIIRRFFEGRFGIPALELTSDEVMQRLKDIDEGKTFAKQLQTFFTTADLVKFAQYHPTPEENEQELSIAYDLVRGMIPKPAPQPVGVEDGADVR